MEKQYLQEQIRSELLGSMDLSRDLSDEEIRGRIRRKVMESGRREHWTILEKQQMERDIFDSIRRLDVLQELVDDPEVSEIMVNGPGHIFIEKGGRVMRYQKTFSSPEKLLDVIQQIVARCNRVVNETMPIVDARLENGSRVNVVLPPVAINGPILTIRRFPDHPFTMDDLVANGTLPEEIADFLEKMVICRENIFVSGGTSSGKTTFLNVLGDFIPRNERIITIEDSAELNLRNIPNLVRLECRNANLEGLAPITIRDLIRTALRERPDRILVGEVRSGEAVDMISAMNTGHDGSLSTGHANSCQDMLKRLETMFLMAVDMPVDAIRRQIAAGIDLMVHLERTGGGKRKLVSVEELVGYQDGELVLNPIYTYRPKEDGHAEYWEKAGCLVHTEKYRKCFPGEKTGTDPGG